MVLLRGHIDWGGYDAHEDGRTVIVADKGYLGIRVLYPGAEVWMPAKSNAGSDPETGGLIQQDRDGDYETPMMAFRNKTATDEARR